MTKKKEDLRVRKTKANLYKGLLKMLEQKSFEDIKIIDICNVSLINRSTFYDHFNDKYELLSSYLKDASERLADNLVSSIQDKKYTSVKSYYLAIIKSHLDYLYNDVSRAASVKIIKNNLHSVASDMLVDFTLNIVFTDCELSPFPAKPYTVSVGIPTTPFESKISLASARLSASIGQIFVSIKISRRR
jgi:AcrR family transcriptional regulator